MFQKGFTDFIAKYEATNTKTAQDIANTRAEEMNVTFVTGSQGKEQMKEKIDDIQQQMVNPFQHIKNWIKGEVMRLNALLETIMKKEGVEAKQANARKDLKAKQETVRKLNDGKFVLGASMFKGSAGKADEKQKLLL